MKLYNDDCLNVLKNIPSESIDLILTDCPYHIVSGGCTNGGFDGLSTRGKEEQYKVVGKTNSGYVLEGTKHIALFGMFNELDPKTYTKQGKLFQYNDIKFSEWLPECYRVLKNNTHIYIYINARNLKDLQVEAEKAGFIFQQLIVWKKNNATPNRYYLNGCEFILMMRKGNAKNINNMGTLNYIELDNKMGNKIHPTEKPVELNKIFIENSTKENELVMDLFMGSGSCGVACKELNRDFIGIEIDEKYFQIAKERIENC